MTTRIVYVGREVPELGRVVKMFEVRDHETGRTLYGPAPYADCISWRRGKGRAL